MESDSSTSECFQSLSIQSGKWLKGTFVFSFFHPSCVQFRGEGLEIILGCSISLSCLIREVDNQIPLQV